MKIKCEAILVNPAQQDNLCQCITILGGTPIVENDKVSVIYDGEKWETMVGLFEHYVRHTIHIAE